MGNNDATRFALKNPDIILIDSEVAEGTNYFVGRGHFGVDAGNSGRILVSLEKLWDFIDELADVASLYT